MKWKYIKDNKRLNVYGIDADKDIAEVKKLINDKKIPSEIDAIVYQKAKNSVIGSIIRGRYLENLLRPDTEAKIEPLQKKLGLKAILKQINDANARQASYAGLLVYATTTKRFLFFTPRNRGYLVQLLGDNPQPSETPPETVCRVALEDGGFEISPEWLVSLIPLEFDGTAYHNYLCLTEREFKPTLSARIINSSWRTFEGMEELNLHQSVSALFEKDKKLIMLTSPIEVDFDKLIDEILHST